MQFGIFTVGDVTADPTTGRTPSEAERIRAVVAIARKAEEVGLDVFALGEHHNPPFFSSSPTTTLAYIAAPRTRLRPSPPPPAPTPTTHRSSPPRPPRPGPTSPPRPRGCSCRPRRR